MVYCVYIRGKTVLTDLNLMMNESVGRYHIISKLRNIIYYYLTFIFCLILVISIEFRPIQNSTEIIKMRQDEI